MSVCVAHIRPTAGTEDVRIYQSMNPWSGDNPTGEDTFYWCCAACGACSDHVNTMEAAVNSGTLHKHTEEYENAH